MSNVLRERCVLERSLDAAREEVLASASAYTDECEARCQLSQELHAAKHELMSAHAQEKQMQSRFAEEVRESAVKANEEQVAASFEWASEREAYLSAEAKAGSLRRTLLSEVDNYRAEALIQVGLKNEFQMEKESAC